MAENSNALDWRRSRFCGSNTCVEVASNADVVLIRDGKDRDSARLRFDRSAWRTFIAGLRSDEIAANR
ncbi:DUF397 domain-containing protein [Dactylosporangium sp. McL0621]|uniref:DUF397 domain-containing protein n=1 Tax=Dactylosporangium sp. McL0621 TaxID=3415678 RepID=UPI003CF04671